LTVGYVGYTMRLPQAMRPWLFALTHWNWKVVLITAICRAIACMAALRHTQAHAREHFGLVEAGYVLLTAGVFSALQQQSLGIKTRRLAWLVTVIIVPLVSLGADVLVHQWLDQVNAHTLGIGALAFTLISAMFHWHIMQHGAMLVGESSSSFWTDMKRMPKLLLSFVTEPVLSLRRMHMVDEAEESELELAA
jgi:hypothetical protein